MHTDYDKNGKTALHHACTAKDINLIKYLVKNGVDINKQDMHGRTVLHQSARNIEMVKCFIECDIDVNIQDSTGLTGLHYACSWWNAEIVELLIKNGADVNITDKYNRTCLHHACLGENLLIFKYLIDSGVDINHQDIYGRTVLHQLCLSGTIDMIKYIVKSGANLNIVDNCGHSALYIVCRQNKKIETSYLEECGGTFGEEIEKIYNLFHQSPAEINKRIQDYIENESCIYFPFVDVPLFNNILSLECIPEKYKFFKSDEFKEILFADVISPFIEENCEYKGRLLYFLKGFEDVKLKVSNTLKNLYKILI